jgi:hypothetical protein
VERLGRLVKAPTCAVVEFDGAIVEVETDRAPGLLAFSRGLPVVAVREAKERVRAAICDLGLRVAGQAALPLLRIVSSMRASSGRWPRRGSLSRPNAGHEVG